MGQRSQIYVRIQEGNKYHLIARYFGWNFAERMISRCRHTLEWIMTYREELKIFETDILHRLVRIMEVNFDMKDIVLSKDIIREYHDLNFKEYHSDISNYVFYEQHNNDGRLFIDVPESGSIKYAFLDDKLHEDHIMDAATYMEWDCADWENSEYIDGEQKKICKNNIKEISRLAQLMTKEEIADFISCDYISY